MARLPTVTQTCKRQRRHVLAYLTEAYDAIAARLLHHPSAIPASTSDLTPELLQFFSGDFTEKRCVALGGHG